MTTPPMPWFTRLGFGALTAKHWLHKIETATWILGAIIFFTFFILAPRAAWTESLLGPNTQEYINATSYFILPLYIISMAIARARPRDPLGYRHGISFEFREATKADLDDLVTISHSWFGSSRFRDGQAGRSRYFSDWIDARENKDCAPVIWVLVEHRQEGKPLTVGYSSILPLNNDSYLDHFVRCTKSQYDMRPDNLEKKGMGQAMHPIYLQAIAIHPARFGLKAARVAIKNLLADHIASIMIYERMLANAQDYHVCDRGLYIEAFSEGGRGFIVELGGTTTDGERGVPRTFLRRAAWLVGIRPRAWVSGKRSIDKQVFYHVPKLDNSRYSSSFAQCIEDAIRRQLSSNVPTGHVIT